MAAIRDGRHSHTENHSPRVVGITLFSDVDDICAEFDINRRKNCYECNRSTPTACAVGCNAHRKANHTCDCNSSEIIYFIHRHHSEWRMNELNERKNNYKIWYLAFQEQKKIYFRFELRQFIPFCVPFRVHFDSFVSVSFSRSPPLTLSVSFYFISSDIVECKRAQISLCAP